MMLTLNPRALRWGRSLGLSKKTQKAINLLYYALPDLRGMFLRGMFGASNGWDPQAWERFSPVPFIQGDTLGAYEWDTNLLHDHTYTRRGNATHQDGTEQRDVPIQDITDSTSSSGDVESAPVNISVNYVIKY